VVVEIIGAVPLPVSTVAHNPVQLCKVRYRECGAWYLSGSKVACKLVGKNKRIFCAATAGGIGTRGADHIDVLNIGRGGFIITLRQVRTFEPGKLNRCNFVGMLVTASLDTKTFQCRENGCASGVIPLCCGVPRNIDEGIHRLKIARYYVSQQTRTGNPLLKIWAFGIIVARLLMHNWHAGQITVRSVQHQVTVSLRVP